LSALARLVLAALLLAGLLSTLLLLTRLVLAALLRIVLIVRHRDVLRYCEGLGTMVWTAPSTSNVAGTPLFRLFCYSRNYGQRVEIGGETVGLFDAIAAATKLRCDRICKLELCGLELQTGL
jgi:hypothetical protein